MLEDSFGRHVSYLRLSITDRCDFRCGYCMKERMRFLPKDAILKVDEIDRLCGVFTNLGVTHIRLTGGEPLVRREFPEILQRLSSYLKSGALKELTITTNGSQLKRYATEIYSAGVRRINVSLDTRDPKQFAAITRHGRLESVLEGLEAAQQAGLSVKINMVALKGVNEEEIVPMIVWAHGKGMTLTLIEVMPMAETDWDRRAHYLPLMAVRQNLEALWTLENIHERRSRPASSGPASYVRVKETGGKIGFIAPLTGNFCDACNRVRVASSGYLYPCLGRGGGADLRAILREEAYHDSLKDAKLKTAILSALQKKKHGHEFEISEKRVHGTDRPMSLTGG